MGYYTVLLTNNPSVLVKRLEYPHAHSVRMCDLDDLSEIEGAIDRLTLEGYSVCAVVSFIDPYCLTAAVISEKYGLRSFSHRSIAVMLDKIETRERLRGTPYSPFYHVAHDDSLAAYIIRRLPLVLKSPVSSGSKDVLLAATAAEYKRAFRLLKERHPSAPVLAEAYIDSSQFLIETLTVAGKTHIAAVVEQDVVFNGRFIVTGYRITAGKTGGEYNSLREAAETIIERFGMADGPCHLEMRRWNGGWALIEANPRISGGAMNSLIRTAYGVDLARETLRQALGYAPDLKPEWHTETYLHYLTVPKGGILERVTGKAAAQNCPGVEHVYIKPRKGAVLSPPVSMGHRYAYVIASGATAREAERNAKTGTGMIHFHLRDDVSPTRTLPTVTL
jgi:biotin carboxylase